MAAVAHNPAFAKKVGIPQSVGKEFNKADKGRKFGTGGAMAEKKKDKFTESFLRKLRTGSDPGIVRKYKDSGNGKSIDPGIVREYKGSGNGTSIDPGIVFKERDISDEEPLFRKHAKGGFVKGKNMIKEYGGAEKYKSKAAMKKHEAAESPAKEKAEGKKAKTGSMQKIASRAVKSHEKRMHGKKMSIGGSVDGCATRGKTKGTMR